MGEEAGEFNICLNMVSEVTLWQSEGNKRASKQGKVKIRSELMVF